MISSILCFACYAAGLNLGCLDSRILSIFAVVLLPVVLTMLIFIKGVGIESFVILILFAAGATVNVTRKFLTMSL